MACNAGFDKRLPLRPLLTHAQRMYLDSEPVALALYVAIHRMRMLGQVSEPAANTALGRWLAMSGKPAALCIGDVMEPLLRAWRR